MPKGKAPCNCLSIIILDSVIEAKKNYYPQKLLEECKYEQEKIEMEKLIHDDLKKKVSLMGLKQNLILIMANMMSNLLKVF